MKTVFITVSESSIASNLLRGTFFQFLSATSNLKIVLIVPEGKTKDYANEFGRENVRVEGFPKITFSFFERITVFFARNVFKTEMTTFVQMRQFHDDKKLFALIVKRVLWHILGNSKAVQSAVRWVEPFLPSPQRVEELFNQYKPDLLFTTVTDYTEMDVPMLREAKKRGVKTIGMMRGWDTFVAHGFLRIVPDRMLLQNEYLRETGVRYQFLPELMFTVVGFPHFEWHFRKDFLISREEFCRSVGIDPKKRIILFGAMEYYWFPRDGDIAAIFNDLVRRGELPDDLVLLFRPYPGFTGPIDRVKNLEHVVPDMEAFSLSHGDNVEMREKQTGHLLNSISHSELVMSVISTIVIDGVTLGKPGISVLFERGKMSYWESVGRFATHCTHFMDVFKTGGIRQAFDEKEFAKMVRAYLANPRLHEKEREALKKKFVYPYDGKVGERIANELCRDLGLPFPPR